MQKVNFEFEQFDIAEFYYSSYDYSAHELIRLQFISKLFMC